VTSVAPTPVKAASQPRSWVREASGAVRRDVAPKDLAAHLAEPGTVVWVDIDSTNRHHSAWLENVFKFHPLAIEDTLNPQSRVKLDEYDGFVFTIVRGIELNEETSDPHDVTTFNICCFLGRNFLVTTHARPVSAIEAFATRCDTNPDVLARGAARAMYVVLDTAVDAYFPVLDRMSDAVDELEERVFAGQDREVIGDLIGVKRAVLQLRRHLAPGRDVFNALANRPSPFLTIEEQRYFRDVHDHVLRINDTIEQYRDMLSSVLEASLTQTSNRLGLVTKGLSIVATISVPFVVVSGMWGMNFETIPLSGWPQGFWLMLVIQLALGLGLLACLRHRGWF
jgi:magnesium transporter